MTDEDVEFYCTPGTKRSPGWYWDNETEKFRPASGLDRAMRINVFVQPTHFTPLPPASAVS